MAEGGSKAALTAEDKGAQSREADDGIGSSVVILKFGTSVLESPAAIPRVVSEIYRYVRRGQRVLAVISTFKGDADALLREGRSLGCAHENVHLPRFVALGGERATALVAIGCDRVGLDSIALSVAEMAMLSHGDPEAASPDWVDVSFLKEALSRHDVVLAPGHAGVSRVTGDVVLLEPGGSDLTAVLLAAELGVGRARLLKEAGLVRSKVLEAARERQVTVEVAALGSPYASVSGPHETAPATAVPHRPVRVALAGCGVVGGGVLERLRTESEDWKITGVLVRDIGKLRDVYVPGDLLTSDPDELLASRPDILVEALSEGPAGAALIRQALKAGVHVVSANKQAVASDPAGLNKTAHERGLMLSYSAAVGGGTPMIETIRRARQTGNVTGFEAVLNGTVNFMLESLSAGAAFVEALAAARRAGFAEEDPSADLDGDDAAAKVRLLTFEAFSTPLEDAAVRRERLTPEATEPTSWSGLRQIGRCRLEDGTPRAEVVLTRVDGDSIFTRLAGERNAIRVLAADGRELTAKGRGAGRWPTTESVLGDIAEIRRHLIVSASP